MTTKYSMYIPTIWSRSIEPYSSYQVDPNAPNYTIDPGFYPLAKHTPFIFGYMYVNNGCYPVFSQMNLSWGAEENDYIVIGETYGINDYYVGVWSNAQRSEYQVRLTHNYNYVRFKGVMASQNHTLPTPSDYNNLHYTAGWDSDMYPYPANHSHLNMSGGAQFDIVGYATYPGTDSKSRPIFVETDNQAHRFINMTAAQKQEYINYFDPGTTTVKAYVADPVILPGNTPSTYAFQLYPLEMGL